MTDRRRPLRPDRGHPADRGHDLRVLRQPDRAVPAQDRRRRRDADRQPRDRDGDDPLPARPSRTAPRSSGPSRPPATTSATRPARRRRRAAAASLAEARGRGRRARARAARAAASRPLVSIARRRSGSWSRCSWPQTVDPAETLNRLVLIPATFIQFWAGGRFYRAAWRAARHGTTNMDTLVAVGTTRGLGVQRRRHALCPEVVPRPGSSPETYFDSSTIIIGLVLLGRWLEARAKVRTAGAIRRLVGLQPTTRRRRGRRRTEAEVALEPGRGRRPPARPAGRPDPGRRRRRRGRLGGRRVDADRRADPGRGRRRATRSSGRP